MSRYGRFRWRLILHGARPWSPVFGRLGARPLPGAYRAIIGVMPTAAASAAIALLIGAALLVGGLAAIRSSGARAGMARRLAGAREVAVGTLLDPEVAASLPPRPVRIAGRIRCGDPIVTPQGDRLVAFHRDVEVSPHGGTWRTIERLRETRSFELWDHDGWLTVDPAQAAEPLVVLPRVWEGDAAELDEGYRPAVERLAAQGVAPSRARATTRTLSVVDRLLVLGEVRSSPLNGPSLTPPRGGYLISSLDLDAAMRVLGGPHRARLLAGAASVILGLAGIAIGLILTGATLVAGV